MNKKQLDGDKNIHLLDCPFCGKVPPLPDGRGTQYDIECSYCGQAIASVQICDLMTIGERLLETIEPPDYKYSQVYVDRAKAEAIELWNTRAESDLLGQCLDALGECYNTEYGHPLQIGLRERLKAILAKRKGEL